MYQLLHVGLDDTDSPRGGCTTYVAALAIELLLRLGVVFVDYPNIIRLNPNVPWKTRGNGAVCLRILVREGLVGSVEEGVLALVRQHSDLEHKGTNPGLVFLRGQIPTKLQAFSKRAIQGLVSVREAKALAEECGADTVGLGNGRGIVGALAAVGGILKGDHTFEFVAYRRPDSKGARQVDCRSVVEVSRRTAPFTFSNVDFEARRILVTPHGPDPVLYGIRGESPEIVRSAHQKLRVFEPIERWVIFRTNHGTDSHLNPSRTGRARPYYAVILRGTVVGDPVVIPGGHVKFTISSKGNTMDCIAYEPTGALKRVASQLIVGDLIEVYGGVRPPSLRHREVVNLEKVRVVKLARATIELNPACPNCGKRLKSAGLNKGFKCGDCGLRSIKLKKVSIERERWLKEGTYIASPKAHRHLTKPYSRYGFEKGGLTYFCKLDPPQFYWSSTWSTGG